MADEKDSRQTRFRTNGPQIAREDVCRWLRDGVEVDADLARLVEDREQWRQQGLTKVPASAKAARKAAFKALSQLAPSVLAELPHLTVQECKARAINAEKIATSFAEAEALTREDEEIVRRVLRIAAWKTILHTDADDQGPQTRRERAGALQAKWTRALGLPPA